MLSYQHGFHAGTFADVVKHLILTRIISYLIKKDKPLLYLETHAGSGLYDLESKEALKTGEAKEGILALWEQRHTFSALFQPYFQVIEKLNPNDKLRYYPGSPFLAMEGLREQDRFIFSELHPKEFTHLTELPTGNKRVLFKDEDGIQSLYAFLPPTEHRGFIFIDPSFEIKTEYSQIPKAMKEAYKRFSTGIYCLWYPIINAYNHEKLLKNLQQIPTENTLRLEFYFSPSAKQGMRGCGLWIINPPYTIASEAKTGFDCLTAHREGSFYLIKEGSKCA